MPTNKQLRLGLLLVMSLTLAFALAGCGGNSTEAATEKPVAETPSAASGSETSTAEPADWETFLDEYDAWVDDYAVFVDKYIEDPTDTSLLADYAAMSADLTRWASDAKGLSESLNATDATEYASRTLEISKKLEAVATKLAESLS